MMINSKFSNPLDISSFNELDQFKIRILNSSLFVSEKTGLRLVDNTTLYAEIPKQLPEGVN